MERVEKSGEIETKIPKDQFKSERNKTTTAVKMKAKSGFLTEEENIF